MWLDRWSDWEQQLVNRIRPIIRDQVHSRDRSAERRFPEDQTDDDDNNDNDYI